MLLRLVLGSSNFSIAFFMGWESGSLGLSGTSGTGSGFRSVCRVCGSRLETVGFRGLKVFGFSCSGFRAWVSVFWSRGWVWGL